MTNTPSVNGAERPPPADPSDELRARPRRRWPGFVLRAAGTAAILGFLLSRLDVSAVGSAMLRTGLLLWMGTSAMQGLLHVLAALKWQRLLNACGLSVSRRDAVRAHFAGLFANTILPSIIGGDAVRLGLVVRDGSRLTAAATAGAADRTTDVVALILVSTIGGLFVTVETAALRILFYATSALLVGIVVGVTVIRWLDATRLPPRPAKAVVGLQLALKDLSARKSAVAQALVVALGMQSCLAAQNVFLGAAIGIDVPAAAWFVAWPVAKLVALTPVSLGGLGLREGAIVALLLPFGVDPDLAMAEALVWYTLMLSLGLMGGALSWWMGRTRPPPTP